MRRRGDQSDPVGRRLRSPPFRAHDRCGGERNRRPTGGTSAKRLPAKTGFSLIEVIVALGILGGGLVVVMAMFAPLARVGGANADLTAATDAATAVNAHLRQMPFATAAGLLRPAGEIVGGTVLLVSRSGEWVGPATDPVWNGREGEPYFAVTPVRNTSLGGPGDPSALPWLAFTLRVRWPVTATDEATQRELIFPGSLQR